MRSRNAYLGVSLAGVLSFAACSSKGPGISINHNNNDLGNDNNGTDGGNNNNGTDGGNNNHGSDGGTIAPPGTNQVPLVVDTGPSGAMYATYNAAFVSVKICAPGDASNCATIDHVAIDTGSVGMRIQSQVIPAALLNALPMVKNGGNTLAECYTYADGYTWGSVRSADVYMGGEMAGSMSFHVQGDMESQVPAACAKGGKSEDTVDSFGYNGIIGISGYGPDCGAFCESSTQSGQYYACGASGCSPSTAAQSLQVKNPAYAFGSDNNGVVITLPTASDAPQGSITGTLTFGINTQTNNQLGSGVSFYPMASGDIATQGYNNLPPFKIAGASASMVSLFDSGTTDLVFDDSAIATCAQGTAGANRYCPTSNTTEKVTATDGSGATHEIDLTIANATNLFTTATNGDCVFKDLADPAGQSGAVAILGLPFFYGRTVYIGIDGQSISGAMPPFEAF